MASITISQLNYTGLDLLSDYESYLTEVTDFELDKTKGGFIVVSLLALPDILEGLYDGWNGR